MQQGNKTATASANNFSSNFGFILACVGSAVGMGNIWMFPYRLGEYGGGAFLVPYILFVILFSLVGLSAEFAIGRRARTGTLGAYEYCWNHIHHGRTGYLLGWIPLLGSLGIAIGYAVIVGWVVWAFAASLTGTLLTNDAAAGFAQTTQSFGSLPWHMIVIISAAAILISGVTQGIEKVNKILMPAFFLLFAFLAIWVFFLPNTAPGYAFMFTPHWNDLLKADTWVMAMGQAFFSLSITGSGMIVYGSYLHKDENIPSASIWTGVFDTLAAMLAALAIIPAVFSFGIEPNCGPALMFITLPQVFKQMPFGQFFSIVFFLSVIFAGITSLINMFEAVSESWQKRFHLKRNTAIILCSSLALLVGIFIEGAPEVGTWMDFVTIIIVPLGAVFGAVSFYYVLGYGELRQEMEQGRKKPLPKFFGIIARYIYVPLTAVIFVLGIMYGGL